MASAVPPSSTTENGTGRAPDIQNGSFRTLDWGLFLSISLIWGASFLLMAEALEGLTPATVTLGRVSLGAVTLVFLRLLGGRPEVAIERGDWPRVFAIAVVWIAVPFTLFPLAQETINSALTGLLNGAVPVFVAVLAAIITRTRPRGSLLVGLIAGFVGVVTLSLPSLGDGPSQVQGVLLVLAATVCYGIAFNLAGPLQRRYGAVTLMTPIMCFATVLVLPAGLWNFGENEWSLSVVVPVIALGVVGTGLAYWIMSTLVGRVGPVPASFITYLIPVVSLILGVVIRGDRVAPLALVGAGLTTFGALLASGRISLPTRRAQPIE